MISVCMATYNGERYIRQQIDSILCQLSDDDELIISDDGSTDGTIEMIKSYNDNRIKILFHRVNTSFTPHEKAAANFENAINHAFGDYIFLTDQDDIWLPVKINKCVSLLKHCDLVLHNYNVFEYDIHNSLIRFKKNPVPKYWFINILQMKFRGCCIAFKKNILNIALPFPYKLIGHDHWLSTLGLKYFSVKYIEEPLILYRKHIDSVSYEKKNSLFFKIQYRIRLFLQLCLRKHKFF